MDSVTQIVLGAAVGEAVLGKKIGNRAMFWGGIAGTLPDLDILSRPFISEIQTLIFHRGFSHSILFSILGGGLMGWLVYRFYKSRNYKWIAAISWMLLAFVGSGLIVYLDFFLNKEIVFSVLLAAILILGGFLFARQRYFVGQISPADVPLTSWMMLFFLCFLTHALLDSFTMYGTQLFWPFSNYRVAFNTISVVDPAYTLPFLICVMISAFIKKENYIRFRWNTAGLVISSLYLLFTIVNKQYIDHIFKDSLDRQGIEYTKCITGPTIMNNILWNATIETDSVYMHGTYSWFDSSEVEFVPIPKNHEMVSEYSDSHTMNTLRWFTKGFYNIVRRQDGKLQVNDLRYGTFHDYKGGETNYVFRFTVEENEEGILQMKKAEGGPPSGDEKQLFKALLERIKGK